ncbi:hypothetical protein, partial [Acerihabitans sp.]|uniref:hypothetical protein n=1 Tax=Acerihabitans sp. TaxID=2811394 RepID=UPI002ED969D2
HQLEEARRRDFQALAEQFQYHINLSKEVLDKALAECHEDHDGYHSQPRPTTLAAAQALDNYMQAQVLAAQHKKQSAYQALSDINDRLCHLSTGVIALHKELSTTPSTPVRERYLRQEYQLNLEKTKRNNLDHAARARAGQLENALIRKNETGQILAATRKQAGEQKVARVHPVAREADSKPEKAANPSSESLAGNNAIPASVTPSMAQVNARRAIALSGMAVALSPGLATATAGVNGGQAAAAGSGAKGVALRTALSALGSAALGLAKHPLGLGVGLLASSGKVGEGSEKVPGRDPTQRFAAAPAEQSEPASAPQVSFAAACTVGNNFLSMRAGAAPESGVVEGTTGDAARGKIEAAPGLNKATTKPQEAACLGNPLCVTKLILHGQGPNITATLPVADDLTGGKLENPLPNQTNKNIQISPDTRSRQVNRHTGNTEGKPHMSGNTMVTPIPDGPKRDELAHFNKISQGDHAIIRNREGRPVSSVIKDVQTSRPCDILVQNDGRWVILGDNGRVHLLEKNGQVITSFKNVNKNTTQRVNDGRWHKASNDELADFKDKFTDYVRW